MAYDPQGSRRQIGGELVIPVLAIAFTLYYFSTIIDSPWTAQVSAGALGSVLLVLCTVFVVRSAVELRRGEGAFGFANLVNREDLSTGRVWLFLATLGYCLLINWLGFTLTTFLFLAISMLILARGQRAGLIVLVSGILALGGWALFIWAFSTRFPRGWFEETMRMVLING